MAVQGREEKGTEKLKQFAKIVQVNCKANYGRYKSGCLCSYFLDSLGCRVGKHVKLTGEYHVLPLQCRPRTDDYQGNISGR